MVHILRCLPPICLVAFIASGCASNYSPNTYASNAVQLANKVETGSVVGYRQVAISSNGTVGAVTGGAAGGVLGAQYADSALAAVGASAVGLVVGNALDHAVGDTTGWEYIVRKPNGEMVSVTQREKKPLELGQKVLVIMGPQARVVPDYSSIPEQPPVAPEGKVKAEDKPQSPVKVEVVLSLAPGVAAQLPAGQTIVAQPVSSEANVSANAQANVQVETTRAASSDASPFQLISTVPAQLLGERDATVVEDKPSPAQ